LTLNDITRCMSLKQHGRDCDQVPPDGITQISLSNSSARARGSLTISPHEPFNNSRVLCQNYPQ